MYLGLKYEYLSRSFPGSWSVKPFDALKLEHPHLHRDMGLTLGEFEWRGFSL